MVKKTEEQKAEAKTWRKLVSMYRSGKTNLNDEEFKRYSDDTSNAAKKTQKKWSLNTEKMRSGFGHPLIYQRSEVNDYDKGFVQPFFRLDHKLAQPLAMRALKAGIKKANRGNMKAREDLVSLNQLGNYFNTNMADLEARGLNKKSREMIGGQIQGKYDQYKKLLLTVENTPLPPKTEKHYYFKNGKDGYRRFNSEMSRQKTGEDVGMLKPRKGGFKKKGAQLPAAAMQQLLAGAPPDEPEPANERSNVLFDPSEGKKSGMSGMEKLLAGAQRNAGPHLKPNLNKKGPYLRKDGSRPGPKGKTGGR